MSQENTLDIIKGAILLERKGKTFYETTARNTASEAVREIFETMAAEEEKHADAEQPVEKAKKKTKKADKES